ncbi:MAG TPA: sigma-70 family RNA polymerase sigma factor [Thermoanaerobaculia bacterium]|nr:sigma-70 family RNA polymerase sigma factor [Thermoanaerobaculia bacterium]
MDIAANATHEGLAAEPLGLFFRLGFAVRSEEVTESAHTNVDPLEARAIAAVKDGNPDAYDYVVSKYMRRVVSIAWGILRRASDAEDLAQEAFVKAFESIGRFKTGQPFGPWIYRIVTNLSLDLLKHRKRFRDEELSEAEPAARRDRADLPAIAGELAARIDQAIESLPEMQRVVARLYLVEEFGHREIALMTGLSEGTVRSHLSLGRRKLQEKLADLHEGSHE